MFQMINARTDNDNQQIFGDGDPDCSPSPHHTGWKCAMQSFRALWCFFESVSTQHKSMRCAMDVVTVQVDVMLQKSELDIERSLFEMTAISLLLISAFCVVHQTIADTCSWQNCNEWSKEKDTLNVHLICHSHDDLGWVKTVEEYYYGAFRSNGKYGVQYILNTVISELQKDPTRRFIWAETGFLWRWMNRHSDFQRHNLAKLIRRGQLEIVGGGWAQNDEATAHYVDIIDQMAFGLRKLNETFGKCAVPRVGWQIDPFGHSREMANIYAMMGYEGLFFARLHYLEKKKRLENASLEFIWNASDDLKTDILTGAFVQDNYGPPDHFCFDEVCEDDPIMADAGDKDTYNIEEKAAEFVDILRKEASHLKTNHIMALMGTDFTWSNANMWYTNLDALIKYINSKESEIKVRLFYSTPSCYMDAVNEAQPHLSQKSDDFFPYASANHSLWTGYFSSRPALKGFIRKSSSFLQLAKQLDAVACLGPMDESDLDVMRKASALVQHHDAVTGTATDLVTKDYRKRLAAGWDEGEQVINDAVSKLVAKGTTAELLRQTICRSINETKCEIIGSLTQFTVTVHNSNSHPMSTVIRIPYYNQAAVVIGPDGTPLDVQLTKTFVSSSGQNNDQAPFELLIPAQVPALGFATFFVSNTTKLSQSKYVKRKQVVSPIAEEPISASTVNISNGIVEVDFDENGYVSLIKNLRTGQTTKLRQEFLYYEGTDSREWQDTKQASGAYIFRPNGTVPLHLSNKVTLQVVQGALISEARQTVNEWASQVIRLVKGKNYVEFEWTIGPIPKEKDSPVTKEVITRYTTDVASNGMFYTDANGRQIMTRKRNFSPSFEFESVEPVASNYYPVNSRIFIKDDKTQFTVLNDRSQGGSSLSDGQIELMLHRRCFSDDGFGVNEALNETESNSSIGLTVRGVHWIVIDSPAVSPKIHRPLALELFHSPMLTFAPLKSTVEQYRSTFETLYTGLKKSLPDHINILTLEQWTGKSLLLRLEHIYQNSEDQTLSQPVTLDLEGLFTSFKIRSMEELKLGANVQKQTINYRTNDWNRSKNRFVASRFIKGGLSIEMKPMEIRTFRVDVDMSTC